MSKLPQVKAKNLVKVALKLGFKFRDQSGSHTGMNLLIYLKNKEKIFTN